MTCMTKNVNSFPLNAGVAHEYGSGVSKDLREAARWYSLAAAQGLAESNYHLGLMKAHGRGFAQDFSGAAIHFQKVRPLFAINRSDVSF